MLSIKMPSLILYFYNLKKLTYYCGHGSFYNMLSSRLYNIDVVKAFWIHNPFLSIYCFITLIYIIHKSKWKKNIFRVLYSL